MDIVKPCCYIRHTVPHTVCKYLQQISDRCFHFCRSFIPICATFKCKYAPCGYTVGVLLILVSLFPCVEVQLLSLNKYTLLNWIWIWLNWIALLSLSWMASWIQHRGQQHRATLNCEVWADIISNLVFLFFHPHCLYGSGGRERGMFVFQQCNTPKAAVCCIPACWDLFNYSPKYAFDPSTWPGLHFLSVSSF